MSNLQLFEFDSQEIRVIDVNGNPWFVLSDVLKAIGTKTRPADAKASLLEELGEEVATDYPLLTAGGMQNVLIINESALTFVVSRSLTETGKRFNRWIHSEVLPSIRKTGTYSVQSQSQSQSMQPERPINKLALEISRDVREIIDNLVDNPCLAQFLVDLAVSEIMPSGHTLEPSNLKSVSQIAFSLGLPVDQNNCSKLESYVNRSCIHLSTQLYRVVDEQEVFGTFYPKDNEQVIETIIGFFC